MPPEHGPCAFCGQWETDWSTAGPQPAWEGDQKCFTCSCSGLQWSRSWGWASGQDKGEAHMKDTQTHTVENERTPNQRDRDERGREEGGRGVGGRTRQKAKRLIFFFWKMEGNELRKQRDREGKKKEKRRGQGPIPWLFSIRCARPWGKEQKKREKREKRGS